MKRALIQPERCHNCHLCAVEQLCPMTAVFRESPKERPWIDFYRCSGCLRCKPVCPNGAIAAIAQPCGSQARIGW